MAGGYEMPWGSRGQPGLRVARTIAHCFASQQFAGGRRILIGVWRILPLFRSRYGASGTMAGMDNLAWRHAAEAQGFLPERLS